MRKTFVVLLAVLSFIAGRADAQLDRSVIPGPGPAPATAFPDYDVVTTANGMRIIIVQNHELPTIDIQLLVDRKPVLEKEMAGVVGLTGQLMRSGTTKRTKDQLDEEVDRIGASIGASGTSVSATGLSRHTDKLFELLADVTLHPSFPQSELQKLVMQAQSGLKARKAEPDAIVSIVRKKVLYGDKHPYGEVESEASVGRINRAACEKIYKTFFVPNAVILAVVGDIQKQQVLDLVKKHFGSWKQGKLPAPVYPQVKPLAQRTVALVDRSSSVQSAIRVAQTVELPRTSPDVMPVTVLNKVLGGGISRLFVNLREKHSYTYGAYSAMGPDELIGAFTVQTSVRNVVTDSAITEIFYELNRIRNEAVSAEELDRAKNSLSGNFVQSLEKAETIAGYAIDIERYKLPKDHFRTYLQRVAAVTPQDVQRVAQQYITPEKMLVAVVGSAKDVKAGLAAFGPVAMYDEEGNPVVEKAAAPITVTADQIFAKFIAKTGGKEKYAAVKDRVMEVSGKIQGMDMKIKSTQKAPASLLQEVAMMGMVQKQGYNGTEGWASSPMGTKVLDGEDLEDVAKDAPIEQYGAFAALGIKAEVTGRKDVKGKECYEVTLTGKSGLTTRHYFDTKDFLKVREVSVKNTPRGPVEQVTDLMDYKEFGGLLLPAKQEQTVMGTTFVLTLDKCTVNTGVADSLFVKPEAAKK
jgi:zinc protease